MITVYKAQRLVTSFHGLCGKKVERAIFVYNNDHEYEPEGCIGPTRAGILNDMRLGGWVYKKREYPTKSKMLVSFWKFLD